MRNKINENKNFDFETSPEINSRNISLPKPSIPIISLNEYLSRHNRKRILDNVIRKWFLQNNRINPNPKKTKEEWDKIMESFQNETEK